MKRTDFLALLCIFGATTLCVLSKFGNQFVYDDVFVVGGRLIHDPSRLFEVFASHAMLAHDNRTAALPMDTYRPLSILTFFWDAWISGHEPWSYHVSNHLIHLSAVSALYVLARAVLPQARVISIASACLFFAISPQLAEAHVWINGRSDPLAAVFGLAGLWMWTRAEGTQHRWAWLAGASASIFCGLLCKEVLLFGLVSLILFPGKHGESIRKRGMDLAPLVAAGVGYLGLRTWALSGLRAGGGEGQLASALGNLSVLWFDGLRELLMPSRLYLRSMRDEYALVSPVERIALGIGALVLAAVLWRVRKRLPVLTWGAAWFATTLAPAAMISAVLWPGFGRYLYLPCAGLALGLAELVELGRAALERHKLKDPARGKRLSRLIIGMSSIYLLALGARLAVLTDDYSDNRSLYLSATRAAPRPAYAYAWLGASLQNEGKYAASVAMLTRAVELDGSEPRFLNDLVRGHLLSGQTASAVTLARAGIARTPRGAGGKLRFMLIQALAGPAPEEAVQELCACLTEAPKEPDCSEAPLWMLDPRGPNAVRFRQALMNFGATCPSRAAQAIVAPFLAAPSVGS